MSTTSRTIVLRSASGAVQPLDVGRWSTSASPVEHGLLAVVCGPTLDVGCGPGRLVAALAERGVPALGIDVAPAALRQARHRGAPVLDRSVFDRVPAEGRWPNVLLFDGNIGIGGDPAALLARVAALLAPDGVAIVEVEPPGRGLQREAVVLECDGARTPWFPWAWVGVDAVEPLAVSAGLELSQRRTLSGRCFAWLRRTDRRR